MVSRLLDTNDLDRSLTFCDSLGQYFVTTKTTLCKNQQSFFYKLLQDDPSIGLTTDRVNFDCLRNIQVVEGFFKGRDRCFSN